MLALLFTNLLMLAGLSALAVPVVIHLLLRQRRIRMRFSTLQFFARQEQQASQKRKLRNWFLLALRLLLFALLVTAFARPYLPKPSTAGAPAQRRQVILVLDRSLSMQAVDADGPRWTRALEAAQKLLRELNDDDRAALVSCGTQSEVLSGFASPTTVANLLKELQPTFAAADLGEGLRQATKLLEFVDPAAASAIHLISDLQKNSFPNLEAHPIPQSTEVEVWNIGDAFTPNVAITGANLDGQVTPRMRVELGNFSDEDSAPDKLSFLVDGREVLAQPVSLKAGASTNLEVFLPSVKPGWHTIEARWPAKDASLADNARYQTVLVPQPVRVLLVETRPSRRTFEEESFFLAAALNPAAGTTNSLETGFLFEKIPLAELANKLPAEQAERAWDVVMLPGLKAIPSGTGRWLANFTQVGGGVVFFLGDGLSANRYNSEFRDLLPARLDQTEAEPDSSLKWRVGDYETNTALFAAFRLPNSGNLALAEFHRRFTLTPHGDSLVAAHFDDGAPLVVSKTLGKGKVVLVNTSADTRWTDWPKHKTYVPWLHGLGRYLAGASDQNALETTATWTAGEDIDLPLEASARGQAFTLQTPAGQKIAATADEQGLLRADLSAPGIYVLRDAARLEVRRVAVNVPAGEADLAVLLPNEFQHQLARTQEVPKRALTGSLFGSTENETEVWRFLLLGAVALLLIESFVANRTLA